MSRNTPRSKTAQNSQTSFWKSWKFLVSMIVGCCIILAIILANRNQPVQYTPPSTAQAPFPATGPEMVIADKTGKILLRSTEAEGLKLVNDLFASINPAKPENSYMTPFMKEKINWLYGEIAAKRVEFQAYAYYAQNSDGTNNDTTLMGTHYYSTNGGDSPPYQALIQLYMPRLLTLVRIQQKVPVGFNQLIKNTFALMIVHEAVHLEQPAEYFVRYRTNEERAEEERRAWAKVDINSVRKLRQLGQPLDSDWIQADDILIRCGKDEHCPEFLSFIKGSSDFNPHAPK